MLRSLVVAALMGASSVLAVKCSADSKCPKATPCCSTYGECGVGAYCLGGCDPQQSFSLDSCMPAPVCENRVMRLNSLDTVMDINDYVGNASAADWVSSGEPLIYKDNLLLTMPKDSVGTVLSSSVYVWYGNIKATLKTSRGAGVVTAFILFSDVKDEIDFEWVGVDLHTTQTNYYFQGVTDYQNSGNVTGQSDTFENFHTFEVNWTPDQIQWLVDGKVGRTKLKKDTYNETTKNFDFPQTPARVQLSLWPGGLSSNAQGTIDWAGGAIDWEAEDIKKSGYFYATFSEVEIACYNATSGIGSNSGKSYVYTNEAGLNSDIKDGDKSTIMGSLEATGLDPNKGKQSKSKDSKNSKSTTKNNGKNIPGGSNAPGNSAGGDSGQGKDGSSSSSSGSSSGNSADPSTCNPKDFNQKCDSSGSSSSSDSSGSGNGSSGSTKTSASALAIIIAACALFWL